jgi:hypothetical protein
MDILESIQPDFLYEVFQYLPVDEFVLAPLVATGWYQMHCTLQRKPHSQKKLCEEAAATGNLTLLQYARQSGCPWRSTCYFAALNGHLEILQWMHAQRHINSRQLRYDVSSAALRGGHLNVVQWAHSNGFNQLNVCDAGVRYGHRHIIEWGLAAGYSCSLRNNICFSAAQNGFLDVLKWAHSQGYPFDIWTCQAAAERGHLTILQWLREN